MFLLYFFKSETMINQDVLIKTWAYSNRVSQHFFNSFNKCINVFKECTRDYI
jgi:hypothetical protein